MSIQPLYLAAAVGVAIGLLAAPLAVGPAALARTAPQTTTQCATGTAYDGLPSPQQASLFARQFASGELVRMSDEQVLAVFQALQPDALLKWARAEINRYLEYEYWMARQERLNGQWQEQPATMQIRYRHAPRQLYAKWLAGGAQSGQEILYDEIRRKDEMYGHLGVVLGFTSMWIALEGTLARSQSNHTVRDLGFQYVLSMLERDAKTLRAAGLPEKYNKAEIVQEQGVRMVALTWDLPAGAPQYYARKVQLMLDLKHPYIRVETAWDADGNMVEKIVFDKLVRKTFEASAFDPGNPDYRL